MDVIQEQHERCFGAPWVLKFCLWMTTPSGELCNIVTCFSIRGYHPAGLVSILTGLNPARACVGYAWPTNVQLVNPLPTCLRNFKGYCLMSHAFPTISEPR
ncbi:hypothetical protein TNCV_1205021 [Trichonephila clavipes]|nr:hypothetical protein TNCV_1205021 [Trichonephila clavipes]